MARRLSVLLTWGLSGLILAWTVIPLAWMVSASLKTDFLIYARPPRWLFHPTFVSYHRVLY